MTSAVKSQKFSILFDWFDQGGDGQLTHDDFQAMAGLFAGLAAEGDHTNATAMREAFEEWWQLLLKHGDTDGDGQVSRQEFITVMEANVTSPQHFEGPAFAPPGPARRTHSPLRTGSWPPSSTCGNPAPRTSSPSSSA